MWDVGGVGAYLVRIPFLFRRNPRMVIAAHETSDMGERMRAHKRGPRSARPKCHPNGPYWPKVDRLPPQPEKKHPRRRRIYFGTVLVLLWEGREDGGKVIKCPPLKASFDASVSAPPPPRTQNGIFVGSVAPAHTYTVPPFYFFLPLLQKEI